MVLSAWLAFISATSGGAPARAGESFENVTTAVAVLRPTKGNGAEGIVVFSPTDGGVELSVRIWGLPSGTRHGFHVHEFGDCSAPDATSAGEHYDPTMNLPGMHHHGMRPLGDLEDLAAGQDGKVEIRFKAPGLTVAGAKNAILGRGLVLHASFDNPNDPMSSSGARIACGTIGVYSGKPDAAGDAKK